MASEAEELAGISDYVVAILRSPTWVSPISKFVDDNCGIFEDAEENKLEYTFIHNAFRQLVDDLLVAHLCEMSLSTEQFMRFCENGLSGNNELHRSLVEQLISVEDFMVFKAMMVKRNCEINREVLGPSLTNAAPSSDEMAVIQQADALLEASAEEAERLEAERRCVEAELQLAEALSLQLEKRLQLMEALDEVLELVSKIYKLRADALEQQVAEEKERELELLQQDAIASSPALTAPALTPPALLAPVRHHPQLAPVINANVTIRPLNEAPPLPPISPLNYQNAATTFGLAGAATVGPDGMMALQHKKAEAQQQKDRVDLATAIQRKEPMGGPSEEEKHARTEHLKRQRAALIEKKNQERENNLACFQQTHGVTNASQVAAAAIQQQPDAGKRLADELSGLAVQHNPEGPNPAAAAVEMRRMLTRQLRNSFQ